MSGLRGEWGDLLLTAMTQLLSAEQESQHTQPLPHPRGGLGPRAAGHGGAREMLSAHPQ